jgi:hypothetical protein
MAIIEIQGCLLEMWFVRNDALHNNERSEINVDRHKQLNDKIENIFRGKPHNRLLPQQNVIIHNIKETPTGAKDQMGK